MPDPRKILYDQLIAERKLRKFCLQVIKHMSCWCAGDKAVCGRCICIEEAEKLDA